MNSIYAAVVLAVVSARTSDLISTGLDESDSTVLSTITSSLASNTTTSGSASHTKPSVVGSHSPLPFSSSTGLPSHREFSFDYESTSEDDLEVSVSSEPNSSSGNGNSSHDDDDKCGDYSDDSDSDDGGDDESDDDESSDADVDSVSTHKKVFEARSVDPTILGQALPAGEALYQGALESAARGLEASINNDDIVYVTRYSYSSLTLTQPTETTAQIVGSTTPTQTDEQYRQGYQDGFSQGQAQCAPTDGAAPAAFTSGYVQGADWGYRAGYFDGSRGRPFVLPSFANGATPSPVQPTPASIQYTTLTLPVAPTPPPVSYTTLSYFVPYGGEPFGSYEPYGYPYREANPQPDNGANEPEYLVEYPAA